MTLGGATGTISVTAGNLTLPGGLSQTAAVHALTLDSPAGTTLAVTGTTNMNTARR